MVTIAHQTMSMTDGNNLIGRLSGFNPELDIPPPDVTCIYILSDFAVDLQASKTRHFRPNAKDNAGMTAPGTQKEPRCKKVVGKRSADGYMIIRKWDYKCLRISAEV